MERDELDFLISQYADGTLDAERTAMLDSRLDHDVEARAMLDEHRRVTRVLRGGSAMPAIRWDRLAAEISSNIDQSEERRRQQVHRFAFGRWAGAAAAVAACLLLGWVLLRGEPGARAPLVNAPRIVEITLAAAETTQGPRVAEVSIASPEPMGSAYAAAIWDELDPRSTRIVIGAGEPARRPDALGGY